MPTQTKKRSVKKSGARPSLEFERGAGFPRIWVAGVDEVGRGCLAGPVVAGAVILPAWLGEPGAETSSEVPEWLTRVNDSKLLTASVRDELAPLILAFAHSTCIAEASVEEIDKINILQASHLAMLRALQGLKPAPKHILIDGNRVPKGLPVGATAIVKGDSRSISIACASIIAKVYRDKMLVELDAKYPGYGLGVHKGYSTPQHQEALKKLGATIIHRQSFAPVKQALRQSKSEIPATAQPSLF